MFDARLKGPGSRPRNSDARVWNLGGMIRRATLSRTLDALFTAALAVASLAPLHAQSQPAATVVELSGQVSRLQDNYPKALWVGDGIRPNGHVKTPVLDHLLLRKSTCVVVA